MPLVFLFAFRFVRLLLSGHQAIAIENAALRVQIAAFQRKRKRPLLTSLDRLFWVSLRSVWSDWRHLWSANIQYKPKLGLRRYITGYKEDVTCGNGAQRLALSVWLSKTECLRKIICGRHQL
jgi:hypothetical protein